MVNENEGLSPKELRDRVQQLEEEQSQLYRLLAGIERLGKSTTFWDGTPDRLPNLVAQIRRAFGYRAVALWLFEGGKLCLRATVPDDEPNRPDLEQAHMQAVNEDAPITVMTPSGEVLVVPLVEGIQRVGVMDIVSDGQLSPGCDAMWRALAPQITSLVIGGRLLTQVEEARRRQQVLYEITRHLSSGLNLDKTLSDVLALTIPYTEADDGSIMILDDRGEVANRILTRKQLSPEEEERALRSVLEGGLASWVLEHKQATIVNDTLSDERWVHLPDDRSGVRSALAAPLKLGDRVRGLVFLVHREPEHFDADHLSFLSAVADQAAVAVENAYLLEQTQRRMNALAAINEISQAASTLHLNDVLQIVAQRIVQTLHARRCAIFLLDRSRKNLVLRAVKNPDVVTSDFHLVIPLHRRPHIAEAIETLQPVEVPDVFADHRLRPFWDKARELGIKSQVAVPLVAKQRVIGAISIDRSEDTPQFTPSEIELFRTIANQAANAIENARLYEEVQRRAEHLWLVNMVSHDIGALLDIDTLLWEVVRLIRETFDCYHVAIALIEDNELVFKSGINYLYQPMPRVHLSLEGEGEGIPGWVAGHGRSYLAADVRKDPVYRPMVELPDTRSELAVPLKVPERAQGGIEGSHRIIGVLDVHSTEVNAFSVDDQDLLEALAAQVAVAVESARLFTRMRDERATLEAILNGTSDAIIVTDTADRILFFNPAARNTFLDGGQVQGGQPLTQVVQNEALLDFWSKQPRRHSYSAEIPLPDGRTLYATMTTISGVGKVAVMQDITHLKELDKLKSDFVSTVSHDLRSPLQVIQTSAELLPRLGELNHEQRKEVEHILAVVRRMAELIGNLLDIGRIEAGIGMEVEPCAVDEIIARVTGTTRSLAESKGLEFKVEIPPTLPLVKGNPLRLEQVVANLVSNAIKFTPEGSVTISAYAEGDEVMIEVRDTGVGIPPEAMNKLFQKFYRVSRPETRGIQGTGLGLAIAKSIVESYGGRIEVESFPRLGSTFTVVLPVYREE